MTLLWKTLKPAARHQHRSALGVIGSLQDQLTSAAPVQRGLTWCLCVCKWSVYLAALHAAMRAETMETYEKYRCTSSQGQLVCQLTQRLSLRRSSGSPTAVLTDANYTCAMIAGM